MKSMKIMKIKLTVIIIAVILLTACQASIPYGWDRLPFEGGDALQSRGVIVVDFETGETLFSKNEAERMNAASTMKIMTALLTLDIIGEGAELDELVTVTSEAFAGFDTSDPNTIGGSLAAFISGQENLTYRDCLYGLMLPSGNDAANVLALNLAGPLDAFVVMMNQRAEELGAVNTYFSNAHGLLEGGNFSSAYDLALFASYAYERYPLFREIVASGEYLMPANSRHPNGYRVANSNCMVRYRENSPYYRELVKGIKNGALDEIFYRENGEWVKYEGIANLVSIGEIDGRLYLIVTLEAPWKTGTLEAGQNRLHNSYIDHIELYDWLNEYISI